jgi:predicted NBD/HSP70 family sugar kinase
MHVHQGTGSPFRVAVVSAADPVDRRTGRLVHLPDAPFLVGELSPAELLAPCVGGPVIVDNDVNWAARAEREADASAGLDDFAYVYLGEGLGCAVVSDGEVRRGHAGFAGEIAHLVTTGTTGRAVPLTEVFAELGLRHSGSTAIEVGVVLAAIGDGGMLRRETIRALATAISGVLAAVVALADPELIVIGGSWGIHPLVIEAISAEFRRLPRHVPIRAARDAGEPSLAGARSHALHRLRAAIVAQAAVRRGGEPAQRHASRG